MNAFQPQTFTDNQVLWIIHHQKAATRRNSSWICCSTEEDRRILHIWSNFEQNAERPPCLWHLRPASSREIPSRTHTPAVHDSKQLQENIAWSEKAAWEVDEKPVHQVERANQMPFCHKKGHIASCAGKGNCKRKWSHENKQIEWMMQVVKEQMIVSIPFIESVVGYQNPYLYQ